MVLRASLACAVAAIVALAAQAAEPATPAGPAAPPVAAPTVEQLFAAPRVRGVTLSPDGRQVALSLATDDRNVIALYDLDARQARVLARDPDRDLIEPLWVSATRLVYRTWDYRSTLPRNRAGAVHAIDSDGSRPQKLWDSVDEWQAAGRERWLPMTFLAPGDAQRHELLVTLADRAPPPSAERFPGSDVYAVDSLTGRRRLLTLDNPGEVQTWFADAKHRVRAAMSMRVDKASGMARYQMWHRDGEDEPWTLQSEHAMDEPGFYPAGIGRDGTLYAVGRIAEDTLGLYRWNVEARRQAELLLRHPHADISHRDLLFDDERVLIGVDVHAMQRERHHFVDKHADLQATIDRALPGRRNRITLRGGHALVISSADTDPGTIHRFDAARSQLEPLWRYLPALGEGLLARKTPIRYRARDGLEIPAYLTLPRGTEPKALPLVVFPHGGPAERDSWGDYWEENEPYVQLLASRGWAVLQPQYRGSYGLGWRLFRSGWKQWADGSIDDLVDGVNHLIERGTVDAKRVCTMGKSAGGYSAMYSLIRYPKAFRCGVSWAGTTDMALFFSEASASYAGSAWLNHMAPWTHVRSDEHDYMRHASVARNAEKIEAPVLLAYGSSDTAVPLVHGERLREALARIGKPPQWIVYPDEGHGWSLQANRVDFARAVERFLAEHLAPRGVPDAAAPVAKEIESLIATSVERIEQGSALADKAGVTMGDVVQSIRRVADVLGEISSASTEQRTGVTQVGAAVSQMDQATQQNAALVEESTAAAESLEAQAGQLVQAVAVFKVASNMAAAAPKQAATATAPAAACSAVHRGPDLAGRHARRATRAPYPNIGDIDAPTSPRPSIAQARYDHRGVGLAVDAACRRASCPHHPLVKRDFGLALDPLEADAGRHLHDPRTLRRRLRHLEAGDEVVDHARCRRSSNTRRENFIVPDQ